MQVGHPRVLPRRQVPRVCLVRHAANQVNLLVNQRITVRVVVQRFVKKVVAVLRPLAAREGGVDEHLAADAAGTLVAVAQRAGQRKVAPGRIAHHADFIRADAKLFRLPVRPAQRGIAGVKPGGVGVLGRKRVIDRQHDTAHQLGQQLALVFHRGDDARKKAAAVKKHDAGPVGAG